MNGDNDNINDVDDDTHSGNDTNEQKYKYVRVESSFWHGQL